MKNLLKLLPFAMPILLLGGCATVMFPEQDMLAMGGKYSEIASKAEDEDKKGAIENSADLVAKCIAYSRLKTYNKLFACLEQMEGNISKGNKLTKHHGLFSWNYPENIAALPGMLRAEVYIEFGDYEKAIASAKVTYQLLPTIEWTDKDRTNSWGRRYKIRSLGIQTLAHALAGDRKTAAQLVTELESVEATSREFWLTPGGVSTAIAKEKRFMLARANMALGKYHEVLADSPDFWEAFGSISEGLVGYSIFAFVDLPKEFMKSKALYETGKIKEAKAGYDRLLSRPETKSNGEIYWPILFDSGKISQAEGNASAAIVFYRQAVDVIENQRSSINTEASKIGFVGDKQAVYGRLIAVLIEQGRAVEAFDYVERSKSRALVDMLAAKKDFAAPDPTQATRVLAALDAADLNARIQDEGARPEAKTTGARNLQVAREALQSAAPELSTLVTVSSVPSAELKALVGPDETLIEYYYQGADLYAFLLDRERLLAVRLDATELASQVQTLRKTLEAVESPAWQAPARALYGRLWQPLEKLVTSKNIIVVAHGALHYLPFAALQDGNGQFLLDRYSLRFLPSASVLKFLRPVLQNKDARLLALGNPDLDDPKLDLAFAEGEAKLVASLYPSSRVLLRKDASESNFKKAGGVFSRIHFASHGKFQADEPLKSGLYLAKDADNDGILTVGELYSMNLEADLVTLSACETGLGKIASGDDVVGLTRGFLYAGSRSIVASLWSVDDKATATLMQAFYANLASMNKREALRQAQIKARETFPHPFFWAAFQLTGRAE